MRKLLSFSFFALLTSGITILASIRNPNQPGPQAPRSKRTLRVLIEGDGATLPTVITEMRKGADKYDLDLEFVSDAAASCDVRIVVTEGSGKLWCSSTSPASTEPPSMLFYYFATATVFDGRGHFAFTTTGSGEFSKFATSSLADGLLKKLAGSYAKLRGTRPSSQATTPVSKPEPSPDEIEGIPLAPGVYYKTATGWAEIVDAAGSRTKTGGMPLAILSRGLASIHVSRVYAGPAAAAHFVTGSPMLYVQGLGIDSSAAAIVKLERKNGSREVKIASVRPFGAKSGYPSNRVTGVTLRRITDNVVALTPSTSLGSGEYVLTLDPLGSDDEGFDFGIVK